MRQVPLFSVVLLDQISLSIIFPVLAFIFFDKSSTLFSITTSYADRSLWYGICMALMCLSSLVIAPLLSFYSDTMGRKIALLGATVSALTFALFSVLSLLTGSLILLLLGSFIGGRCTNANPIAQAIIGDNTRKENKVSSMGHLQFFIAAGAFIGPILGGYFAKFNFSLPCIVALSFSAISIIIILSFFKENKRTIINNDFRIINKDIIIPLILIQISWSAYYQFIPAILKNNFHFDQQQIGLFIGLIALWLCVAATFGIKILSNFFENKKIIYYAGSLMLLGFLAVNGAAWFFCKPLLWLSGALVPIGDVMAYSALTALFSSSVSPTDQGKMMGLCSMIVAIVWGFTALCGGILLAKNSNLPLLIAPIGVILFLGVFYDFMSRRR